MLNLIPAVKSLELLSGFLNKKSVSYKEEVLTPRLARALSHLPSSDDGAPLSLSFENGEGEGYSIKISPDSVFISAESEAGAFYAVQTLRQIFREEKVPCLVINDAPDFKYRGFSQDVSRGKVPTVETVKALIDRMAYYKMNALQLYIEHTFDFPEVRELHEKTSCITGAEMRELDLYCKENFIDFEPSLCTFGHMFEILNVEKFRHLRVLRDYENNHCRWFDRHNHHTIDPTNDESIALVSSLIDSLGENFTSDFINIGCDETFDLMKTYPPEVESKLYVDFVKKIIAKVKANGKRVMMWADIVIEHPECISELPDDTIFLNWCYKKEPPVEKVRILSERKRPQIVCPSTNSWLRFMESVDRAEGNIIKLLEHGYEHGAIGVLNTNWGDWGNTASMETAAYGFILGAAKSWSVATQPTPEFKGGVCDQIYGSENALEMLTRMSDLQNGVDVQRIFSAIHDHKEGISYNAPVSVEKLNATLNLYNELYPVIEGDEALNGKYKTAFLNALDGLTLTVEIGAALSGYTFTPAVDLERFIARYSEAWLKDNKPSELWRLVDLFRYGSSIINKA